MSLLLDLYHMSPIYAKFDRNMSPGQCRCSVFRSNIDYRMSFVINSIKSDKFFTRLPFCSQESGNLGPLDCKIYQGGKISEAELFMATT